MSLLFWLLFQPWMQTPVLPSKPPSNSKKAAPLASETSRSGPSKPALVRPTSPLFDPLFDWPWGEQKSLDAALLRLFQPPPPAPKNCVHREPAFVPIHKGRWKTLVSHGDRWNCDGERWKDFEYFLRGEVHGVSITRPSGWEQTQRIIYEKGKKQGLAYIWKEREQRLCRMFHDRDQLHGIYRCWHKNGRPAEEATYIFGKKQGEVLRWHASGQLAAKLLFREDQPQGTHWYFYPNGKKHAKQTFNAQGQRQGRWDVWFDDGKLQTQVPFHKDHNEGLVIEWHPTGRIAGKTIYRRSLAEGPSVTYHPGGEIRSKGRYDQNYPCGRWRCFDPQGKRLSCHTVFLAYKPLSETTQGSMYPPCRAKPPKLRKRIIRHCADCAEKRLRYFRALWGKGHTDTIGR